MLYRLMRGCVQNVTLQKTNNKFFLCYVVKIYLPIIDNNIACLNVLHYRAYKCIEALSHLKLFEIINMFNYTLYYLSVECYIDITLIIINIIWMLLSLVSCVCLVFFIYTYNYIYMPNLHSMQINIDSIITCILSCIQLSCKI